MSETDIILALIVFLFGAVIGSFLNVCIHRIPRGLSIASPPSRCPRCERRIPFYDNIPIISYILLKGRCRSCAEPFSALYPFVEASTGVFAVLLFLKFSLTPEFFVYSVFVASLIVITFIDLELQIIPDVISLPGIIVGFAASFFLVSPGVWGSAIGIGIGAGILLGIAAAYMLVAGKEGMGMGDVKMLAMIGAFLGWQGVILTLLAGSLFGALIGGGLMYFKGKGSGHAIPFGPFLALGALLHLFLGPEIISWYIGMVVG